MNLSSRLLVALVAGGACLVALAWWTHAEDLAAAERAANRQLVNVGVRSLAAGLPLGPPVAEVWLTSDPTQLPPGVAPVVALDPLGGLRLLRSQVPLPRQLDAPAGVLLPSGGLAGLGPSARATLLAVLGHWLPERPVAPSRVRRIDPQDASADLAWLLAWLP